MPDHSTVIVWFRRDLRLTDHPALRAASLAASEVVPVYVPSTWKHTHRWTGPGRQRFLCESLASLDANLRAKGSRLLVRRGPAEAALRELMAESKASALFFHRDPDPFGRQTDAAIERMCADLGVACHAMHDHSLHAPDEVLTQSGSPYRVFTPYFRNWTGLPKAGPHKAASSPPPCPAGLASDPLPTLALWGWENALLPPHAVPGGEKAARQRMRGALDGPLGHYARDRDIPDGQTTSRLGQDLRYGLISIRELHAEAAKRREGAPDAAARQGFATFIQELAWREFYFQILHHFPEVLEHEFNPDYRGMPWQDDAKAFEAWCEGRTGFPIVDAGMRQLKATGFMHNRVRMITAMFLTKDLELDWRLGERHFLNHLLDGEIASNNGGWQWSAGTGADAAPYFRIQNPWTQSKRFDPLGKYIRRWVPELEHVAPSRFLAPPADARPLHPDYPLPLVDHAAARRSTLERFARHRRESGRP